MVRQKSPFRPQAALKPAGFSKSLARKPIGGASEMPEKSGGDSLRVPAVSLCIPSAGSVEPASAFRAKSRHIGVPLRLPAAPSAFKDFPRKRGGSAVGAVQTPIQRVALMTDPTELLRLVLLVIRRRSVLRRQRRD